MNKMTLIAFVIGAVAIAGGALLASVNEIASGTLMTAGGWLIGWVMKSPVVAPPAAPGSEK